MSRETMKQSKHLGKTENQRRLNLCKSIHYQYCASVCPTGDHHEATCQDIGASIKAAGPGRVDPEAKPK